MSPTGLSVHLSFCHSVRSRFISLKCFFSGNSCQNWTILEHNVPLYGVSIWSSRIIDPGLMTSLMTSSRIIIIDTKGATSQTNLPVSFTEVLVSFNRCALLRYLHILILASEPCRLPACLSVILSFCHSVCLQLRSEISQKRGQIAG